MRLKKLELFGFKSFADRTEVLFDEGVTCVVGPNGCGKSNISDAIRWVLGERSAKLLRGSKMEDVIFSGTDYRKPLALAEVSLTVDNTDRGLPIDYQEVTLTRRLYRSGESEYMINRTICRLKDIQDLILDTGIGSSAYSMIEQGRIDYILNADAEERRFLIEEAAGISKYKVKKEEAIRKLERTEENLVRLNDIVQEVHKNIQYAERQAKRAEKYKHQFEELKKLEIQKTFYDLGNLAAEKSKIEAENRNAVSRQGELDGNRCKFEKQLESVEGELQEIAERFSQEEQRCYGLKLQLEQNEQQIRFNHEKRIELATRRGENQSEEGQITQRLEKGRAEIEARQKDLNGFEGEKDAVFEKLKSSESSFQHIEQELESAKNERENGKLELFQVSSEVVKIKNEVHRLSAWLETSEERKRRLHANLSRFRHEKEQWQSKGEAYNQELGNLEQRLSGLSDRQQEKNSLREDLKTRILQHEDEAQRTERELHEMEIRLQMLSEIDASQRKEHAQLLLELSDPERSLVRSLRDILSVQKGYELALEAALGSLAKSWVAENFNTAEKIVSGLKGGMSAPVTLFIHEAAASGEGLVHIERPEFPLIDCALSDVVKIEPTYESLLSPLIRHFYILSDFNPSDLRSIAAFIPRAQFVTKEGFCFGASGAVISPSSEGSEHSLFQRVNEIRELEEKSGKLAGEKLRLDSLERELKDQLAQCETDVDVMRAEFLELKIATEAQESMRSGLDERLTSYDQELVLLHQELEELEGQVKDADEQKLKREEELRQWTERELSIQEKQDSLLRHAEKLDSDRSYALKEVTELKAHFQHLEERRRLLRESLEVLLESEARDRARLGYLGEEILRLNDKEKSLSESDATLNHSQNELRNELQKVEIALEMIRQDQQRKEDEMAGIESSLQEAINQLQGLQTEIHQVEMKLMDLGYKEKGTIEKLEQAYHLKFDQLKAEDYGIGERAMEEVESVISQLRERVESLGTVNLLAIDEYEELKKRYDFLTGQQKDMQEARDSLLEAIRKINRTTKTLFEETFANVQRMFEEYYKTLFRGGEARLVLVDEAHPLESGIEIVVRPPGKKLQHITLLSGGEKALTAIALLFALFKIKPSPFCVLDEVDAPLDEANIDRFLAVLRTFLDHSQFIIVTHNRKTIGMGDSLYGITMEEAGVSKIVSVKLHEEERIEALSTEQANAATQVEDPVSA